ncbi:hypothetical protein HSX11_01795 [Oxalobacteraceae bacterium]|nr:hypothetical protein [Oxalobacteraceae bacterium]
MPINEPLTLTLAELAKRWSKTTRQVLDQGLPMYFYFDGLVFDFGDKWQRAGGDVHDAQTLEAHQTRVATLEIDLQRQALHKRGQLKLTQWEDALSDEALRGLQAEADRLNSEIVRLSTALKQRSEDRQRHVRNGLLRAAPRTLREITQQGKCIFPHFAFMPTMPTGIADSNIPVAEGAVVALEDGFPVKEYLTGEDLVIAMADIKAAEASSQA